MSETVRYSHMPESPCNTGCPRSTEPEIVKGAAWLLRKVTATPDGCPYRRECIDRPAVVGLGDYRGDQTHLTETYGAWQPPDRDSTEPDMHARAFEGFSEEWHRQHPDFVRPPESSPPRAQE
ncbi:MAG TPA: hypothetical protein VJP80_05445 [Candidatus Saccharimonadales bacterium]|nr:hypothetical protein [Candidatus Saccharimonadales bacterium]